MTSKTFLPKRGLVRYQLKSFWWLSALYGLLLFLFGPFTLLNEDKQWLLRTVLRRPEQAGQELYSQFAVLMLLPIALLFIGMGLIFGSILTDKQAGGICGALITNLTAWLSGIWFDPAMVGGVFATIADVLPFSHGVDLVRLALAGDIGAMVPHLLVVLGYALVLLMLGGWIFVHRQEKAF